MARKKSSQAFTVHISTELAEKFKELSKLDGKSRSQIIRELLESYCED